MPTEAYLARPAHDAPSPAPNAELSEPQGPSIAELSDDQLLASTRRLVGASNQLLAALLAHLAEVEARGVHRLRACSSLYTYCIYELRFSEDAASRRVCAARLVKRFPAVLDAIAHGELHLTGLLMLGPHLTGENVCEVLTRAKHRTKKELAQLVRLLDPLPDVPSRIEPLGPAPARVNALTNPDWAAFARAMCPVRELTPGDRPRDWINSDAPPAWANDGTAQHEISDAPSPRAAQHETSDAPSPGTAQETGDAPSPALARLETTPAEDAPLTGPQRYKVQFTANEEHVQLVERAKALLSHTLPDASIEEVHLRALRSLVADLEKRAYAVIAKRPRRPAKPAEPKSPALLASDTPTLREGERPPSPVPRQRGRYVPAAERRNVFERDRGRCTYVSAAGERCREGHHLELHHLKPFALGGEHSASNLTLRCRAHNALAAEEDFGLAHVERQRALVAHESFRTHARDLNASTRQAPTRRAWR